MSKIIIGTLRPPLATNATAGIIKGGEDITIGIGGEPVVNTNYDTVDINTDANIQNIVKGMKFKSILGNIVSALMGLNGDIDKINSDLADKTSDTGWKTILGESDLDAGNITVPSTGYTVKYRRKNGVVYIQGTIGITGKKAGENLLLFSLPSGYRPSQGLYSTCTSTGYVMSRYIIQTNGNISLEWVRRLSDGTELSGDIIWIGIDISFPVA